MMRAFICLLSLAPAAAAASQYCAKTHGWCANEDEVTSLLQHFAHVNTRSADLKTEGGQSQILQKGCIEDWNKDKSYKELTEKAQLKFLQDEYFGDKFTSILQEVHMMVASNEASEFNARKADNSRRYQALKKMGKDKAEVELIYDQADYTFEKLQQAVEGDPTTKQRTPLNFKSAAQFNAFQKDVKNAVEKIEQCEVQVLQLGSATSGYSGNPKKPPGKQWSRSSDADFAVWSPDYVVKYFDQLDVNHNIVQQEEVVMFKNGGSKGFYKTPLGEALSKVAQKWDKIIYPPGFKDANGVELGQEGFDGFDFKLQFKIQPMQKEYPGSPIIVM